MIDETFRFNFTVAGIAKALRDAERLKVAQIKNATAQIKAAAAQAKYVGQVRVQVKKDFADRIKGLEQNRTIAARIGKQMQADELKQRKAEKQAALLAMKFKFQDGQAEIKLRAQIAKQMQKDKLAEDKRVQRLVLEQAKIRERNATVEQRRTGGYGPVLGEIYAFGKATRQFVRDARIMAAPLTLVGNVVGGVGKTFNKVLVKPASLLATKTLKGMSAGFKALGGVISGAFSFALGPVGFFLKLLEPILNIVSEHLAPAFEAFSDAIDVALGPLDFVLEALAQQLAPIIVKTIQPFVGLLVSFIGDEAPKFITWLSAFAAQAAPLAADLAVRLLPALESVVDNVVDLTQTYGPPLLKFVEDFVDNVQKFWVAFGPEIVDGIKATGEAIWGVLKPVLKFLDEIIEKFETTKKIKEVLTPGGVKKQFDVAKDVAGAASVLEASSPVQKARLLVPQLIGQGMAPAQAKEEAGRRYGLDPDQIRQLAEGGIVKQPILMGEAGPEAVMPLKPEAFANVLGPLVLPGFNAVVTELQLLRRVLQGTLSVKDEAGGVGRSGPLGGDDSRSQEVADLAARFGGVPAW